VANRFAAYEHLAKLAMPVHAEATTEEKKEN
jgi:hypothetical protein